MEESPAKRIWSGFFSSRRLSQPLLAGFAFRAGWWGRTSAGIEHGVDELEDGALVGGWELLDALEPLEQPRSTGRERRRGIMFLTPEVALDLVRRRHYENVRVLGIDGFVVKDNSTEPLLEHSVDLSTTDARIVQDSWLAASEFLQQYLKSELQFEVVLK